MAVYTGDSGGQYTKGHWNKVCHLLCYSSSRPDDSNDSSAAAWWALGVGDQVKQTLLCRTGAAT